MKLYVGNLSFNTSDTDLKAMFGEIGTVESTNIIQDRETGRSRGFAFVEMTNQLNGKEVDGRQLKVNEAKPQEQRSGGGGGGYGGGGGGGSRGGGSNYSGNKHSYGGNERY